MKGKKIILYILVMSLLCIMIGNGNAPIVFARSSANNNSPRIVTDSDFAETSDFPIVAQVGKWSEIEVSGYQGKFSILLEGEISELNHELLLFTKPIYKENVITNIQNSENGLSQDGNASKHGQNQNPNSNSLIKNTMLSIFTTLGIPNKTIQFLQNLGEDFFINLLPSIFNVKREAGSKYYWYPTYPGIYNLVLCDANGKPMPETRRKIYVNPKDNKDFYQLGDVTVNGDITVNIKSIPSLAAISFPFSNLNCGVNLSQPHNINIRIGENMFRHKTVIDKYYFSQVGTYTFKEGSKDNNKKSFNYSTGTYEIITGVKGFHSIENEDTKVDYYDAGTKNPINLEVTKEANASLIKITATANATGEKFKKPSDLIFCCIATDERGISKVYQEYVPGNRLNKENNTISWDFVLPNVTWKRTIEIRVKHSENPQKGYLERSYEARQFIYLDPEESILLPEDIKVDIVSTAYENYSDADYKKIIQDVGNNEVTATVHNKNYICVSLDEEKFNALSKDYDFKFTSWVMDDGHFILLNPSEDSITKENALFKENKETLNFNNNSKKQCFVYVPLSLGNMEGETPHKLRVSVTAIKKGTAEVGGMAVKTFELTVKRGL